MKLNIYATAQEEITKMADYFVKVFNESVLRNDRFSVALSGGGSPKKLYELLATDNYKTKVDWSKVYFFFGDERYVPHTHKDSNYLMAMQSILGPLQIAESHIFPIDTTLAADAAAAKYEATLTTFFSGKKIQFDLVLLGLGDNSHTASLFPHTSVLHDTEPAVKAEFINEVSAYRITLNAPLINNANHIAFLVYGKAKAEAVTHVFNENKNIEQYPAQLIITADKTVWFLDQEAAGGIVNESLVI